MDDREITGITEPTEISSGRTDEDNDVSATTGVHGAVRVGQRFRLIRTIGAGGMSTVFEAQDVELDRRVALKRMQVEGQHSVELLIREAIRLARVKHPNVVEVHEVVRGEGLDAYVVLELIEGKTLARWQESRSWASVLQAYLDAARGLAAAHAQRIIHRDFKANNVVMRRDGVVKVVDFGLASDARVDVGASEGTGRPCGTRGYIAPERYAGPGDDKCDQFSWGVSLWQALSGEAPFERSAADQGWLAAVEGGPHGRIRPAWLRRILERTLRSRPEARFESMAALVRAIEGQLRWRRSMRVAAVGAGVGGCLAGAITLASEGPRAVSGVACEPLRSSSTQARARLLDLVEQSSSLDGPAKAFLIDRSKRALDRWEADLDATCARSQAHIDEQEAACMTDWLAEFEARVKLVEAMAEPGVELPELTERTVVLDGDYCQAPPDVDLEIWREAELARELAWAGRHELATEHVDAAVAKAKAGLDMQEAPYSAAMVEALLAHAEVSQRSYAPGRIERGLDLLDQALVHATGSGHLGGLVAIHAWRTKLLAVEEPVQPRALARQLALMEASASRAEVGGRSLAMAGVWEARSLARVARQELDGAVAAARAASAIYIELDRPTAAAKSLLNLGALHTMAGELDMAQRLMLDARELLLDAGVPPTHSTLLKVEGNLGLLAVRQEDEAGFVYLERTARHAPPAQATKALALATQLFVERDDYAKVRELGWECLAASERLEPAAPEASDHWRLICGLSLAYAGSEEAERVVSQALARERAPSTTLRDGHRSWVSYLIDDGQCERASEALDALRRFLVAHPEQEELLVSEWIEQTRRDLDSCEVDDG